MLGCTDMTQVDSAESATAIAVDFVKQHRLIARALSAHREGDVWTVEVDVGAFFIRVATVHIDARTGLVKEYAIPPLFPP